MEDIIKKELEDLAMMAVNWKNSYLILMTEDETDICLVQDLEEELSTNMYPYLRRLIQCEHLTDVELREFMSRINETVEELRTAIGCY